MGQVPGDRYSRDPETIRLGCDESSESARLPISRLVSRDGCERRGIARDRYDCILNKTPISYKANRKLGGDAPSTYLPRIQSEKQVGLDDGAMDVLLSSHAIDPALLRQDDFDRFLEDRRVRLGRLVEKAMGKPVIRVKGDGEDWGNDEMSYAAGAGA